jgi:hypothetical protein
MYFLIPILNFIGLELSYLKYPKLIYFVAVLIIGLTLYFVLRVTRNNKEHQLAFLISIVLFLLSHYLLLVFLEGRWLIHSFISLTSFALFILLHSLYHRYASNQQLLGYTIENVVGYFNLAVFFFLAVDIFYLDLNLNQRFLWLLILFALFCLGLIYSAFSVYDLHGGAALFYLAVILYIIVEAMWVINLLPISVYSKGAVLSLLFYVLLGLSRHYLVFGWEELTRKVVGRYIVISVLGSIIILATTRWR